MSGLKTSWRKAGFKESRQKTSTNLFRMFAAASEESRRLDPEVTDLFFVTVDDCDAVLGLEIGLSRVRFI